MRAVECVECGAQFQARRSTAKYCHRCKALRQAISMRKYSAVCPGCESRFYKLDGRERFCIECCKAGVGEAPKPMAEPCERCDEAGSEFYPGSPFCIECIERSDLPHADEMTRWLLEQRAETRIAAPPPRPLTVAEIERKVAELPDYAAAIAEVNRAADAGELSEEDAEDVIGSLWEANRAALEEEAKAS